MKLCLSLFLRVENQILYSTAIAMVLGNEIFCFVES